MIDKDKTPAVPKLDIRNCNLVNMVTEHQNVAKSKITMTKLAHARHGIKRFRFNQLSLAIDFREREAGH